MVSSALILLSLLTWAKVEALSLKVRNAEKDDSQLDKEFHEMIGIPHRSEQQDVLLANIEMSKLGLGNEGVIQQAEVTATNDVQDDEEAALDAEFHKLIGFPHRSEEQDDVLADIEMKRLIDEGRIEQSDVDLIAAMDTFDNLMNTAESLSRKERSTRLNDEEILKSMEEVVESVSKAGEKVSKNKAFAAKLLERSMFQLQNIAKAMEEEKVSHEIDEKLKNAMKTEKIMDKFIRNVEDVSNGKRNKRSAAKLEPKMSLNDMLKGYVTNIHGVKAPSVPLREKRSAGAAGSGSSGSLNNMLKGYYLGNNVVKAPSAPLREARSVETDEKFSSAIDAATLLDEALAGLDDDSYGDASSTSSSRKRRNSDGNTSEKKSTSSSDESSDRDYSYFVIRGYSEEEYKWLREEFNLSREEVDSVKGLNEEQFSALRHSLKKTPTEPEKVYTTDDLVGVLKSARELVPTELEAAAHGALYMGYHLGGRAKVAADPVVRMMNTRVLPEAKKMLGNAIEKIPADVKEWAGDGRRIAAKRVQAVAEYAGPRLTRMGKSMAKLQAELSVSAEEKLRELVPKIVPALQMLVGELRDTIELAREVIPPVMQKVGDQAAPYYHEVKDTVSKHVVKPVYAYMTSDTISRPVGQAVEAVTPLGRAAYDNLAEGSRVVYDEMGDIVLSSGEVMRKQVMPAMEELGENARHQAGRVGETVKISVRDVLKSTLDTVFDGVPKILQQVSHEVHDAAKVFRGQYSSALGKMRSRHEHQEEQGGSSGGHHVTSVSPPVFRPSKAPKRTYVTSTEL